MDDRELLAGWVAVWWSAVEDLTTLLDSLSAEDWERPTALPGWDVRAVAAHVAHLETVLATGEEETAEVGEPAHARGVMGHYTEIGVVNRRTTQPAALVDEIRRATATRHAWLQEHPPTDASARPDVAFGGMPWDWRTLLRNRPLDVWLHEQDVRDAVGRPGGEDSPAAVHTADYLSDGLGFVLAKRAGAAPGTTLVLELEGHAPKAFGIGEDGRGHRLDAAPAEPTLRLRTDRGTFVRLAGGRLHGAETLTGLRADGRLVVEGDADLAETLLARIATTP